MKITYQHILLVLFVCGVIGDEVKKVMEGESVTLNSDLTDIKKYWEILWRFGDELIAELSGGEISYKNGSDGSFRDRLQLDSKTASLTITNMKMKHSGLYKLEAASSSSSTGTTYKNFTVSVYAVPDPGLSSGAVAGIVVVVVLLIVSAVAGVCCKFCIKKRQMLEICKQLLNISGELNRLSETSGNLSETSGNLSKISEQLKKLSKNKDPNQPLEICKELKKLLMVIEQLKKMSKNDEQLLEISQQLSEISYKLEKLIQKKRSGLLLDEIMEEIDMLRKTP